MSPNWHHADDEDREYAQYECAYPAQRPSLSDKTHKHRIEAIGPVGLMLQSMCRIGAAIDDKLNLRQWKEQDVSITHTPFQFPLTLITKAAKRGTRRAAAGGNDCTEGLIELDADTTNAGTN